MNAIMAIMPYKHMGLWVFDDPACGLVREPLISGTDTLIDRVTTDIPGAQDGFVMLFSAVPFPGHQYRLEWLREGDGGNWYYSDQLDANGWLCPALLKYFASAPSDIYVQVRPLPRSPRFSCGSFSREGSCSGS